MSLPRWRGTGRLSGSRLRLMPELRDSRTTPVRWIKEGKLALRWTRLSCRTFRGNAVRLQLFALAYNLANFLRSLALPNEVAQWSLTTLREKLVKIGARIVRHGRYVVFQLAEVAVPRAAVRRDPAPDRPPARTARGGGLTGAEPRAAEPRENRAPRSTSAARAGRVGLPTGLRRLLPPGIRRQTRVPVDRKSAEGKPSGRRPGPSGECQFKRLADILALCRTEPYGESRWEMSVESAKPSRAE